MNKHTLIPFSILMFAGALLTGCATMQSIEVSNRSRMFEADYTTTLKAAVDYLNTEGWQISTVDKDLGIINTEFKSTSGLEAIFTGQERYKINFSVQKQFATQTKVIANMLYERKTGGNLFNPGEWTQANMTEGTAIKKYKEILDGVQLKIVK